MVHQVFMAKQKIKMILRRGFAPSAGSWDIPIPFASADLTKHVEALRLIKAFGEAKHLDVVIANAGGDIVGLDKDASGGKPDNNSFKSVQISAEVFDEIT